MSDTRRTLTELAHYPPHGPRPSDPHYHVFNQSQHHLIHVLKVGCWICGATTDDIAAGLPSTHLGYGAIQLEAHHHIVEWAGLSEADWQKVAPDFPQLGIHSDEDMLTMAESEGGLLILCDRHHRGSLYGIHSVTEPIWKLQRYERDDWRFIPAQSTPVLTVATTGAGATVEAGG